MNLSSYKLIILNPPRGVNVTFRRRAFLRSPAASLPNQGRCGPGGTRTRTLELDRLMCSRYTTGPKSSLSWRVRNPQGHGSHFPDGSSNSGC
jgi:hypothetical protein